MLSNDILLDAARLLVELRAAGLRLVSAESCTGGLVCAALTSVAGSSEVVERGFVTYSNEAKTDVLGVPAELIAKHGAVSEEVAREMAAGALRAANPAGVSVSVTGIAGPGGGSAAKPVGLVYLAAQRRGRPVVVKECLFADPGRAEIRARSVKAAFDLVRAALTT
ncbi:MAG: damage-inducible protein CinA [Alphaproteobacteria bacterium BRH_c36]|nr:MAG: damage-inducible protein CinA [Alphaproteobacteria bacterium BRH_c36]